MAVELDFEPANYILIDLFPATVHPGGESEPSIGEELRVVVTDNYFYVLEEKDDWIGFAVREPLAQFDGSNKTGYTVITERGQEYYFKRALNCGCGTGLRGVKVLRDVPPAPRSLRK